MALMTSHQRAILVMICVATLWSIGVLTCHLEAARGFEAALWRSLFSAVFVAAALTWQHGVAKAVATVRSGGWPGVLSGMMWCVMFICFMIALTKTTVANTLVVMRVSPLATAVLAWLLLTQRIAARTWHAIGAATIGMIRMFMQGVRDVGGPHLTGMLIAGAVPTAAAINLIVLKKAGHGADLRPAVLLGSVFSAAMMVPLAGPLQASPHDIGILAVLGAFQLGLPCMLMLKGAQSLPAQETLIGGAVVMAALVFNELTALRSTADGRMKSTS